MAPTVTILGLVGGVAAYVLTCLYQWRALNRTEEKKGPRS